MDSSENPNLFPCDFCEESFVTKRSLDVHLILLHRGQNKPKIKIKEEVHKSDQIIKKEPIKNNVSCKTSSSSSISNGPKPKDKLKNENDLDNQSPPQSPSSSNSSSSSEARTKNKGDGKLNDNQKIEKESIGTESLIDENKKENKEEEVIDLNLLNPVVVKEEVEDGSQSYSCMSCPSAFSERAELIQHLNDFHSQVILSVVPPESLLAKSEDDDEENEEISEMSVQIEMMSESEEDEFEGEGDSVENEPLLPFTYDSQPSPPPPPPQYPHSNPSSSIKMESNEEELINYDYIGLCSSSNISSDLVNLNSGHNDVINNNGGIGQYYSIVQPMEEKIVKFLPCSFCPASFSLPSKLKRHLTTHSKERPHKCLSCPDERTFSRKEHLTKHINSVHSGLRFTCPYPSCKKDISRRDHLLRHIRTVHHYKEQFTGVMSVAVTKVFPSTEAEAVGDSNRIPISFPKLYKTDSSSSSTDAQKNSLNSSPTGTTQIVNIEIKPKSSGLDCDMCPQSFIEVDELLWHQRILHGDIRKYHCDHCLKSFKRREHLQKHLVLHTGERSHVCTLCGRDFPRKDALNEHHKRVHGGLLVAPHPISSNNNSINYLINKSTNNSNLTIESIRYNDMKKDYSSSPVISYGDSEISYDNSDTPYVNSNISYGNLDITYADSGLSYNIKSALVNSSVIKPTSQNGGSKGGVRPPLPDLLPISTFFNASTKTTT